MSITLKRVQDEPSSEDGHRVLVDRLWPRGVSKDQARLDDWKKDIAPSDDLRKAFHGDELTWGEFRLGYLSELKGHRNELRPLAERAETDHVTLLFSSSDPEHNNAVVLKQYLEMLGGAGGDGQDRAPRH